jgi:hypothetical protein
LNPKELRIIRTVASIRRAIATVSPLCRRTIRAACLRVRAESPLHPTTSLWVSSGKKLDEHGTLAHSFIWHFHR